MSVQLLREQYFDSSEVLDRVEISAKRGADKVRQLLTFAEGTRGEGMRVPVHPRRLVQEIETLIQGSFPKDLRVRVQCESKLPAVIGDPTQLHQILLNLSVNARDAMPSGGALTITVDQLNLAAADAALPPSAKIFASR